MSTAVQHNNTGARAPGSASTGPELGGIILTSLILVAAVANLNLSVANVALPSIGRAFDFFQFPKMDEEKKLLAAYQAADTDVAA